MCVWWWFNWDCDWRVFDFLCLRKTVQFSLWCDILSILFFCNVMIVLFPVVSHIETHIGIHPVWFRNKNKPILLREPPSNDGSSFCIAFGCNSTDGTKKALCYKNSYQKQNWRMLMIEVFSSALSGDETEILGNAQKTESFWKRQRRFLNFISWAKTLMTGSAFISSHTVNQSWRFSQRSPANWVPISGQCSCTPALVVILGLFSTLRVQLGAPVFQRRR